jgi:hypothetical protein
VGGTATCGQYLAALPDGSLVIPADLVKRWELLIATPYSELSETEKESDREQVRKYLPLIEKQLGKKSD